MTKQSESFGESVSRRKIIGGIGAAGAAALAGCGGNSGKSSSTTTSSGGSSGSNGGTTTTTKQTSNSVSSIQGAGSTFVQPIEQKWSSVYHKQNGLKVNYSGIGSGGGVNHLMKKTVDFAGSDAPLTTKQYKKLQSDGGTVQIPWSMGAITPVYNVNGVSNLKLDGPTLAKIFLGDIKKWNNSAIKNLNPNANLPNAKITVAHRSDASGTTYGFTGFLSQVSPKWKNQVGQTETPNWPTGVGGKGNPGVAAHVRNNSNSIGYVGFIYATKNNLNVFTMKNKAGKFVNASMGAVSKAAGAAASNFPKGTSDWSSVSIGNAPGKKSWPISTLTYCVMYEDWGKAYSNKSKAEMKTTLEYVKWCVDNGQKYSPKLQFPKIPSALVKLNNKTLAQMTYNGNKVLQS